MLAVDKTFIIYTAKQWVNHTLTTFKQQAFFNWSSWSIWPLFVRTKTRVIPSDSRLYSYTYYSLL